MKKILTRNIFCLMVLLTAICGCKEKTEALQRDEHGVKKRF